MGFRELIADNIKKHKLFTAHIILMVILIVAGLNTLGELSDRERTITFYQTQIADTNEEILSNLQEQNAPEVGKEINDGYILLRIKNNLLKLKNGYSEKYKRLQEIIMCGNKEEGRYSSNFLMTWLILLAALAGSLVQSLRETNGQGRLIDFLSRSSSGLGAGIVCSLFLTGSGPSSAGILDLLPALGLSIKVLISFLAGMFSKELYKFLSESVPALFTFLRSKIPFIKGGPHIPENGKDESLSRVEP